MNEEEFDAMLLDLGMSRKEFEESVEYLHRIRLSRNSPYWERLQD